MGLLLFLIWTFLAVVVGIGANTRGRSGFGWFLLSFLILSPILAGLLLLALPKLPNSLAAGRMYLEGEFREFEERRRRRAIIAIAAVVVVLMIVAAMLLPWALV